MQKPYKAFILNLSITLAYCLLIYIQSDRPGLGTLPEIPHIDKLLHFGAYAVLGVLFFRTFRSLPMAAGSLRVIMVLGVLASALYGVSDEIHQHYVPYRDADFWDGVANLMGSVVGVYGYQYLSKRYRALLKTPDG